MTDEAARHCEALAAAKAMIADAVLADPEPVMLGGIRLRPTQLEAIRQLRRALARHGGALLADEVGLGKTFVALGVARGYARVSIVAPAVLRRMWDHAMVAAGIIGVPVSMESLSGGGEIAPADLVIVDEAHHFRNASTRRYRRLAAGCASAHLLLLSATPVHNARRDVRSLLALFLGSRARTLPIAELSRFVVRRSASDHGSHESMPAIDGPHGVVLPDDPCTLTRIARIPPAVPAYDGGAAAALGEIALVHRWASSRAALVSSLGGRRARAAALDDALAAGRHPTKRDLTAWIAGDGAVQLGFPALLAAHVAAGDDARITREYLRQHDSAIVDLLAHLADVPDPDVMRAARLLEIRRRHMGARVVAFSQYAATVKALGRALAHVPGVATLTADGGRIASGSIGHDEVLAQFGPEAHEPPAHRRIDLLLATDLLSEGVNLQAASVVVHLDLPWNPARLDQRVGRLRRLGSRHAVVSVYLFVPPASADRMLALEQRLQHKLGIAASVVGPALPLLLGASAASEVAEATHRQRGVHIVAGWSSGHAPLAERVAAVHAEVDGALALACVPGGQELVVVDADGIVSTDPSAVVNALEHVTGACAVAVPHRCAASARSAVEAWIAARAADERVAGTAGDDAVRRRAFTRVARALHGAPRHRRASIASLASAARSRLDDPLPAGSELALEILERSTVDDEHWLRAVATLPRHGARAAQSQSPLISALILLVAQSSSAGV